MNWRWCNNEIICTVLRINQRYFSSKKDSVEIFNAYMREVNLKALSFSIYFTYISVSGPMYAQEISAARFAELRLGVVVSETSSYYTHARTRARTHAHTHITNNFSLHTILSSHATPSWTENDLCLLSFVPVYQHVLSFPACFSRWGIKNFYMVFPYSVKERVTKTGTFQPLSKNA